MCDDKMASRNQQLLGDIETLKTSLGGSPPKVALDDNGIWYYQIKETVFGLEI
jgi:hypothetical protein